MSFPKSKDISCELPTIWEHIPLEVAVDMTCNRTIEMWEIRSVILKDYLQCLS